MLALLAQVRCFAQIAGEIDPVDHGRQRIEAGHRRQALAAFVLEGEGLRHRQRLGNTGGLDHQIIETPFSGQPLHLFQQILAQRAANAAVAHLHQLFLGAVQAHLLVDQAGVDVDLAHVVDDYRHPAAVAIIEYVVEHRGLAGAQKPGQHRDRQTLVHCGVLHDGSP